MSPKTWRAVRFLTVPVTKVSIPGMKYTSSLKSERLGGANRKFYTYKVSSYIMSLSQRSDITEFDMN